MTSRIKLAWVAGASLVAGGLLGGCDVDFERVIRQAEVRDAGEELDGALAGELLDAQVLDAQVDAAGPAAPSDASSGR